MVLRPLHAGTGTKRRDEMTNESGHAVYAALKAYGFSPAKAAEIKLDYERRDKYAAAFVDLAIKNFTHTTKDTTHAN